MGYASHRELAHYTSPKTFAIFLKYSGEIQKFAMCDDSNSTAETEALLQGLDGV